MDTQRLLNRLNVCGIPVTEEACRLICQYHQLLAQWNEHMDLTNVINPEEAMDRHYADSLLPLGRADLFPQGASLIDVGTGAGFPGLPLAIARPDLEVVLMDAQQKRVGFLQAVIDTLRLPNVTAVHARAEDGARQPQWREHFDLAVARAVASAPVLLEYLLPFVKVGGRALMWKGPGVRDELIQAANAARKLGGRLGEALPMTLPDTSWDHLLIPCLKTEKTLRQYPRKAGTPSKKPLG
ncbi:MAG: 16S rRNA (guanine(527)-N(7))-methyltransferase RsmG [Clostridia bacterium]|nr:16S rRNA (guanine(527)-N(7))-methyltransferase RsmG [Clostridia bacterium]